MSSMVKVNEPINSNLMYGPGFYDNYSKIITEIYMPYAPSDREDNIVSFVDSYTIPFNGHVICMCCGTGGFKPQFELGDYKSVIEDNLPLKRDKIAQLFD